MNILKKKIEKEKHYQIDEICRLAEIEFVDDAGVPPLMWNYSSAMNLDKN